jgi:hypothetical protein
MERTDRLDSDKRHQWKEDFAALRREVRGFQERMEKDKDLQAVRERALPARS